MVALALLFSLLIPCNGFLITNNDGSIVKIKQHSPIRNFDEINYYGSHSFKTNSVLNSVGTKETETSSTIDTNQQVEQERNAVQPIQFKDDNEKLIHEFCTGTNEFWKRLVIKPVRDYVTIQPAGTSDSDILSKLTAPPEIPGISRPVWLTILGSVPTALGWYGYYKFSVEEELFQYELQNNKPVTGCGGYGTLFPFVYGVIVGFPMTLLNIPAGDFVLEAASLWILLGQVNLYRRVNELCMEEEDGQNMCESLKLQSEPPLYTWWALLPPPLDVVVGLRQVHFLSEFWRIKRNESYVKDVIAEELFPFISTSPRFTLKKFFRTPSMWFWFTKDWKDFEFDFLKESKK